MPAMVRKQIYLTADLDQRLRRVAGRRQQSEAQVIRDALRLSLEAGERRSAPDRRSDALWSIVGAASCGPRDVSKNVDYYLYGAPKR